MTRRRDLMSSSVVLAVLTSALGAQATSDSLRIYYVGRPVGWETYTLTRTAKDAQLTADWSYVDRGRRIHTTAAALLGPDYSPRTLKVDRINDTTRTPALDVTVDGKQATVVRNGAAATVDLPAVAFPISQYTPVSQHLALLRYWKAHGSPASLAVFPGDPLNQVKIRQQGVDELTIGGRRVVLTRYSIDGVVWGIEYAWLDSDGRLAMFTSAGGGLSTKTVRAELVPQYDDLMRIATRAAMHDLEEISSHAVSLGISARSGIEDLGKASSNVHVPKGRIALVGATLIDGTGGAAIPDATVIVADGLIVAAGPSATTRVPLDTKSFDVRGKTIVPGLWDMHAHLHQIEWLPAYIAAGVTSVRDMGNELPFVVALRAEVDSGRVNGPHIHLAGLVDGDGPNAFGAFSRDDAGGGARDRAKVSRVWLRTDEALRSARARCRVGHLRRSAQPRHVCHRAFAARALRDGRGRFRHGPVRAFADPRRRDVRQHEEGDCVLARTRHRARSNRVMERDRRPFSSGIGAGIPARCCSICHAAILCSSVWRTGDRLWRSIPQPRMRDCRRSLATIRALHDAGVPIVAGTDEGIPGFSVYREMELYVMAGFTPMEALRSATAVPAAVLHLDTGRSARSKRGSMLICSCSTEESSST